MNTSLRASALSAGISIALMAVLAIGLVLALGDGATGVAAVLVLLIATLDVVAGVALYPVLAPGGQLLARAATAMRVAYGAVFAVAAGLLLAPSDTERFQAVWDAGLLLFGVHLLLVGLAAVRAASVPTWIGVLVLVAGAGYAVDATLVALTPGGFSVATVTFVGEVVLAIWLISRGGRARPALARTAEAAPALDEPVR